MRPLYILSFLFLMCNNTLLLAQSATIRGKVFEDATGETLPGAVVAIPATGMAAATDFDGVFTLKVTPGTYTLNISFISFETKVIENVKVTENQVLNIGEIGLEEASTGLEEIVVKVEAIKNSENAMLKMKMRSTNVIDGISSDNLRKIGDSDAASSMKRVSGASVEGGKYVFVRGLGDRYTKTTLNGVDIPGLDPDRNALQMDIFPTNVIDNLVVYKSFSAELPADFTGGIIDIDTKDFPEEKIGNISVSAGYNPNFHFNKNYLTYEGGKTDFLGFDDGTRDLPATGNIPQFSDVVGNPTGEEADRYKQILGNFNPTLAAMERTSFMDYSVGSSLGNQINKEKVTHGYNFAVAYKNSTEFYKDIAYGRYGLSGDSSVTEMEVRELQTGSFGVNNVLLSGLGSYALKTKSTKLNLKLLHLQNGESKAGIFDYVNADQGAIFYGYQHNLEYTQKSLSNALFSLEHRLDSSKIDLEFKLSPTLSQIKDPDIRFTRYETRGDKLVIGTEAGFPERIWRELYETNIFSAFNSTKELKLFNKDAKIKAGAKFAFKERDYSIKNFLLNVRNLELTGDPNELLAPENIWPYNDNSTSGTTYEVSFLPTNPNQFNANALNLATYLSSEFTPINRLKAVIGVRVEKYTQRYTGQDQLGTNVLVNDVVLDDLDLFPTANLVYNLTEKQNLRGSYSQTIARPSLKELSYAEIYDPITGRTFIGGLFRDANDQAGVVYWDGKLQSSDIQNFDLRWETFGTYGQMFSVGAFYKQFKNPIEIVQFATQAGAFQPRNVGDGTVLGAEFEFRKSLMFIADTLRNFKFTTNVTVVESRIKYSETEKESRDNNARAGQTVGEYRNMAGQAPYIINTGFSFGGAEKGFWDGFEAGLYYNVQGPTLQFVGIVDRPDIYTVPFHSLNFNMNKAAGKEKNINLGFKVSNILLDKKQSVFRSFNAEDQFFTSINPGINIDFSLSYRFL